MRFTIALRRLAGVAALALSLGFSMWPETARGQDSGAYGVACADTAYFNRELQHSPVELYLRISDPRAARAFLRRVGPAVADIGADAVILLYNPLGADRIGVVPFADGCALETGFMGDKMQVDQMLAGMLHDGLIE